MVFGLVKLTARKMFNYNDPNYMGGTPPMVDCVTACIRWDATSSQEFWNADRYLLHGRGIWENMWAIEASEGRETSVSSDGMKSDGQNDSEDKAVPSKAFDDGALIGVQPEVDSGTTAEGGSGGVETRPAELFTQITADKENVVTTTPATTSSQPEAFVRESAVFLKRGDDEPRGLNEDNTAGPPMKKQKTGTGDDLQEIDQKVKASDKESKNEKRLAVIKSIGEDQPAGSDELSGYYIAKLSDHRVPWLITRYYVRAFSTTTNTGSRMPEAFWCGIVSGYARPLAD